MSNEETKKHWVAHAPSILTASAALIAALTTVYINVRGDKPAAAALVQALPATMPQSIAVSPEKPLVAKAKIVDLQLERLRVDNDGSMGTTDWTFDIQNGERSLFSVPFKALVDNAGENIVTPKDAALARANVSIAAATAPEIIVRGWKQAWSGKANAPDVIGKAKLNADDDSLVIEVKSEKAGGASFMLYFNTRIVQK
jgi:hypothetical protein